MSAGKFSRAMLQSFPSKLYLKLLSVFLDVTLDKSSLCENQDSWITANADATH